MSEGKPAADRRTIYIPPERRCEDLAREYYNRELRQVAAWKADGQISEATLGALGIDARSFARSLLEARDA
jgi:hypothetical protein